MRSRNDGAIGEIYVLLRTSNQGAYGEINQIDITNSDVIINKHGVDTT